MQIEDVAPSDQTDGFAVLSPRDHIIGAIFPRDTGAGCEAAYTWSQHRGTEPILTDVASDSLGGSMAVDYVLGRVLPQPTLLDLSSLDWSLP